MKVILFLSAIPIFIVAVYYIVRLFKPRVKQLNELNPQYDYIIIGGGTAGCVLAARLSEDLKTTVLLLEAGGEEDEIVYSELAGAALLLQNTDFDWNYLTVPQDDCCAALNDQQIKWPRGKVLGGTSILNFVHYVRGHQLDFNRWESELSSDQLRKSAPDSFAARSHWAFKDVEPYFRSIENADEAQLRSSALGKNGPITLSQNQALKTEAGRIFSEALLSTAIPRVEDISFSQTGFGSPVLTVKNGKRVSSVSAYLRPAMSRSNLHVLTRARVNKIIFNFNDKEKKAAGVEYEHNGARHRVLTNKEVILAAGAVNSPQLLQLSGIGPKKALETLDIHVVKDLPSVGKNVKDHAGILLRYSINRTIGLDTSDILSFAGLAKSVINYYLRGSGLLAYPPFEFTGFLASDVISGSQLGQSEELASTPDIQFYFAPVDLLAVDSTNALNMAQKFDGSSYHTAPSQHMFSLVVVLLKPHSSGQLWLQSSNPNTPLLIDPKYFSDDRDFVRLSHAVQFLHRTILNSDQFRALDVKIAEESIPGCEDSEPNKLSERPERFLNCLVRNRLQTAHHPTGSCRMGLDSALSVVDSEFRVHGVNGLRVVDASIIPVDISANPCATVMMIAEKAATIISDVESKRFS